MSEMTLAEMAREIERRKPGTLPKSITIDGGCLFMRAVTMLENPCRFATLLLPDDIAHAILRDAMTMAMPVKRHKDAPRVNCWVLTVLRQFSGFTRWDDELFHDADHGNCPTRSLFAAFCAVFPEVKK